MRFGSGSIFCIAVLATACSFEGEVVQPGSGGASSTGTTTTTTGDASGGGGASECGPCDDADACTDDICVAGACTHPDASNGTPCPAGVCKGGECVACMNDSDCAEGEPCTTDTCDLASSTCTHVPAEVGSPGNASEGGCDGVCQTDGHCGLSMYSKPFASTTTPWTRVALSQFWSAANAPPPRGIVAADHTVDQAVTMVFADDGNYYRANGTTWDPPVPAGQVFGDSGSPPLFDSKSIDAFSTWHSSPSTSTNHSIQIITKLPGTTTKAYFAYNMSFAGAVALDGTGYVGSESEADAPAQQNTDALFSVVDQPAYLGTASWILFYWQYGDAVYRWDGGCPGSDCWTKWAPASSAPFYQPATNAPDPSKVVAAYKSGTNLYVIAP
ncbi:MAG TPA: hypothetical protein VL400_16840 [Polyangiaceae bacterium]|nr:hypothetical protein [Polyangiaceae bacterium]